MVNKISIYKILNIIGFFISFTFLLGCYNKGVKSFLLISPDHKIICTFGLKSNIFKKDFPFYSIKYDGRVVLLDSKLGIKFDDNEPLDKNFEIYQFTQNHYDSTYTFLFGERKIIRNLYNEAILYLREKSSPFRQLQIFIRVYNEGVALRYKIPKQKNIDKIVISSEATQFVFNDNHFTFQEERTDGEYEKVKLSQLKFPCENPLTIEHKDGIYSCITEACVDNYSRMILATSNNFLDKLYMKLSMAYTIDASLYSKVYSNKIYNPLPVVSPWRVILLGNKPGTLLENNYLLYNLNPVALSDDIEWIKPGKVIREMTLTTNGAMKSVDFAKQHNINYIEFDAGWYGLGYKYEHNPASDAKVPVSGLDLLKIIKYANRKNIGVILYINKASLQIQLDTLLPLYSKWGIKGLKLGFIHGRDQVGLNFLKEATLKAAKYRFVIDVHDNFRPSGTNRTYPNLLTQEGVRGNECFPTAQQNTILPFTRLIAGAADYTIAYFNKDLKVTRAHQLAASVIFFSPLQFIFWYDTPECYNGEKEIEFFDFLPVVWDNTKVIDGEIGKFIIVARQKDKEWYVGVMNNENEREVNIPLSFLELDKTYTAFVYSDNTSKSVSINKYTVDKNKSLRINLLPSGGATLRILPVVKKN